MKGRAAITKQVPGAKRGRPPRRGGWNDARLVALRRYYESFCYGRKRNDFKIAQLIYDEWREFRPRPYKKNRTFSSVWAIRYRLPKVRELIWKDEEFERHCGMMGLLDQADIDAAGSWEPPDGMSIEECLPDDFVYEPDEY